MLAWREPLMMNSCLEAAIALPPHSYCRIANDAVRKSFVLPFLDVAETSGGSALPTLDMVHSDSDKLTQPVKMSK